VVDSRKGLYYVTKEKYYDPSEQHYYDPTQEKFTTSLSKIMRRFRLTLATSRIVFFVYIYLTVFFSRILVTSGYVSALGMGKI